MLSKNYFRFLQSFSSCTMMKLVRIGGELEVKRLKNLVKLMLFRLEEVNYYALYKWKL
jgi:hypothetical protein